MKSKFNASSFQANVVLMVTSGTCFCCVCTPVNFSTLQTELALTNWKGKRKKPMQLNFLSGKYNFNVNYRDFYKLHWKRNKFSSTIILFSPVLINVCLNFIKILFKTALPRHWYGYAHHSTRPMSFSSWKTHQLLTGWTSLLAKWSLKQFKRACP